MAELRPWPARDASARCEVSRGRLQGGVHPGSLIEAAAQLPVDLRRRIARLLALDLVLGDAGARHLHGALRPKGSR